MLNVILGPEEAALASGLRFLESSDALVGAVGIHPHDARHATPETLARVREACRHDKVVAWGEIGLDFYYDHSPRENQISGYEAQLDLALEDHLPVIIHCRDAFEEAWAALVQRDVFAKVGGVFHCFTGTPAQARRVVELGGYVSFSGILTFKKSDELREAAKVVPLDRLLIETDAPYLAPMPMRGKRNEPAFVVEVARQLAQIKHVSLEAMADQTFANATRLFRL